MGGIFTVARGVLSAGWLPWALIGVLGIVCAFLYLRIDTVNANAEAARQRAEGLALINQSNAVMVNHYRQGRDRAEAAVIAETERFKRVSSDFNQLRSRIDNAPPNGCVGPAVRAVIDGLRQQSAADHQN